MAHEVDMSNGRANMAYVGDVPWHGFGFDIKPDADIDEWRIAAGMAWNVKSFPATYISDEDGGSLCAVPDRKVLVRDDNHAYLSTVSNKYKVVQPGEVLEFYRDIVAQAGFKMETAGCLRGGRKYWALASIGEEARIMGQDNLKGYVLLATACDGSLATTAMFTSVRVVCANTLQFAVEDAQGGSRPYIKVPHSATFDPEAVKAEMGLSHVSWAAYIEKVNALAKTKVKRADAVQWLVDTFGDPDKDAEEQLESSARMMKVVMGFYEGEGKGSDLKSAKGTAWGLVNAATQFLDHNRKTHTVDARLDRAWFGDGALLKAKAFSNAMKLAA